MRQSFRRHFVIAFMMFASLAFPGAKTMVAAERLVDLNTGHTLTETDATKLAKELLPFLSGDPVRVQGTRLRLTYLGKPAMDVLADKIMSSSEGDGSYGMLISAMTAFAVFDKKNGVTISRPTSS